MLCNNELVLVICLLIFIRGVKLIENNTLNNVIVHLFLTSKPAGSRDKKSGAGLPQRGGEDVGGPSYG